MTDPQTTSDINAANPLQPSTSTSTEMIQANPTSVAPAAPSSVSPSVPTPAAVPSLGSPSPAPQQAPSAPPASPAQKAAQLHTSVFHNVLGILGGGGNRPVQNPDGSYAKNPDGSVKMGPASTKQLGASILAGALSAMVAGMAAPDKRTELGGGRSIADYSGSVAAGANASQPFTQAGTQQKAQGQIDENQARAMATADHNLKFHMMSVASDKADREGQQDVVDAHSSMNEAMDEAYSNGNVVDEKGNPVELYKQRGILGTEAQKLVSDKTLNITQDMITPVGVTDVPNANGDGGSHAETLYDVYNPAAMVSMSDAIRADNPKLNLVANGTPLPVRVLAQNAMNRSDESLASRGLDQKTQAYNTAVSGTTISPIKKDFDLASAIKSDPMIKKILPYINKYHSDSVDAMFADFKKDPSIAKDPTLSKAAAMLQDAMGITDEGLGKVAQDRLDTVQHRKDKDAEDKAAVEAAAKRATPEGQLDLEHKRLENQQLEQTLAQQAAQGQGIKIPNGFNPNPKANEMESSALSAELHSKGVEIPNNFPALYAIAHNAADLATLPTTPRKGVAVMPRDQALSYIRTFINPSYQEGDFSASKKLSGELASTRVGTAGGSLMSAGTAANHLQLLEQASAALKNKDTQLINHLANSLNVALGESPAVTFQAIAEQVNSEVAKVVAGGQPNEPELAANRKLLNTDQSPEQVKNVVRAYIGLMNGRIGEIDDRSMQYFGRHVKGISPDAVSVFNKHGFTTPGQPKGATGTFQSNGKSYWTDGKTNFGPVSE